jgi:hypothetical protein
LKRQTPVERKVARRFRIVTARMQHRDARPVMSRHHDKPIDVVLQGSGDSRVTAQSMDLVDNLGESTWI